MPVSRKPDGTPSPRPGIEDTTRSALAACAWQIRVMASGDAALLYASAQGKYDRVRFRMRQVEAFAKSTTKLVIQRHSNVPSTQPHSHAPQRQSLCANRLQGSFLMPRSPVANARIPSSSCQPQSSAIRDMTGLPSWAYSPLRCIRSGIEAAHERQVGRQFT